MKRREFLTKAACVLAGVALASCERHENELYLNQEMINRCLKLLGVNSDIVEASQLGEIAREKMFDLGWKTNTYLGDILDNKGKRMGVSLDNQGIWLLDPLPELKQIKIKNPQKERIAEHRCVNKSKFLGMVVYGCEDLKQIFSDGSLVDKFLTEYSSNLQFPGFVLHINAMGDIPRWNDISGHNLPSSFPDTIAATYPWYNENRLEYVEIMVNLERLLTEAVTIGFEPSQVLKGVLADEMANALGLERQIIRGANIDPWNEAYSTIADLGAMLDSKLANLFCGGNAYQEFGNKLLTWAGNIAHLTARIPLGGIVQIRQPRGMNGVQSRT